MIRGRGFLCTGALSILPLVSFGADSPARGARPDEVVISAERTTSPGLKDPGGSGSRLDLTPLETPASIDVLGGEVMRARGDVLMVEAASRSAGLTQASAHNGGSLSARGFSGSNSVMRLYDGTRMYVTGGTVSFPFDTWSIERLEVLRGAASVLYGEGAIGAAVNIVPKKPTRGPIETEARLAYGSDSTQRAAIGSGGAIGERWSYRFDGSDNRSDGYVDLGDSRSFAVGGAVRFDATPDFSLALSHDYGEQTPSVYYGVPLINGRLDERLRDINYNVTDAETQFIDNWTRLDANWRVADALAVRNQAYYLTTGRRWINDVRNYAFNAASGTVTRGGSQNLYYEMEQIGDRLDTVVRGSVLGRDNALTVGFDANRMNYFRSRAFNGASSVVNAFTYTPTPFPAVVASNTERFRTRTDTWSLFTEDRLELTTRWSLVGAFRYDHINVDRLSLNDPAGSFVGTFKHPSGRAGVVFEMTPDVSFYAQYATAVDPLSDVVNTTALQSNFDLATGRQAEIGVKQQFREGQGEWTLAAYSVVKNNLLVRRDTTGNPNAPESWDQVGEQSSRGVEASLGYAFGQLVRVDVNGAWLDAKYEDFSELVGSNLISRDGNTPGDVPERTANLWLTLQPHPQWQVLAGLRYVGARFTTPANTSELGSYAVTDASVRWQAMPRLDLALQVYNVFDRFYAPTQWSGQPVIGRPRSVELSAQVKF